MSEDDPLRWRLEQLTLEAMAESPRRRAMPPHLIRAVLGGLRQIVQVRLRHDRQDELVELAPELLDWALGYRAPPRALAAPRRAPSIPVEPLDPSDARARTLAAVAEMVAENGYQRLVITEIAHRAGISLSTFYDLFDGKEDASVAAIEAEGRQAIADIADLGNGSSVQIAVRQIAKQFGRLDIAVITSSEPIAKASERLTDAEWSRAIGFNLGAYFYAARAVAREFARNDGIEGVKGRIIALLPAVEPANAVRSAARAGAEALMQGLAEEWREDGIVVSVMALQPGATDSEVTEAVLRLVG